ncbi:MAG: hypothetical protein ABI700_22215, partial [Chloroflexota bacterium]
YTPREDAVTAGEGAGFGAVVGTLTGILVGLAALMIPGIGLAIVAGPLVAGLTGAVAGAVTGGIVGALVKSGVAEDEAPYYAEGIRRGGTLVSLQTSDTLRAEDIMNRYGAINIHERITLWRQSGWKGFDSESSENVDTAKSPVELLTATPTNIAGTIVTPIAGNVSPITAVPVEPAVEEEPQIDSQDTAKSLPVMVTAPTTDTTISVTPMPNVITAEPVPLVVEKELHSEG